MRAFRLFSLILLMAFIACEAPRDNPLDPAANNYIGPESGWITGEVTSLTAVPLGSVLVMSIPGYRGSLTDAQGRYTIADVPPGEYEVCCSPVGFMPDTIIVTINPKSQSIANFRLDALPIIQSFQVTSRFIWQPDEIPLEYYVIFGRTQITDIDGLVDIDRVTLEIENNLETYAFNHDSSSGSSLYFSVNIPESDLPGGSIESIQGKTFNCIAEDTAGNVTISSPQFIRRFINAYLNPSSPKDHSNPDTAFVTLVWNPFSATYFFTYKVTLYNDIGGEYSYTNLYWSMAGINSSVNSVNVEKELEFYDYRWFFEVVDEYGNSARSEPAYFDYSR